MKRSRGDVIWRFVGSAALLVVLGLFTAWMVEQFSPHFTKGTDVALASASLVDLD